jgi:hypothetical protein
VFKQRADPLCGSDIVAKLLSKPHSSLPHSVDAEMRGCSISMNF